MIVIVDDKRPAGVGTSLSGAREFYITTGMIEAWQAVEDHPEYQKLDAEEREIVRSKYPLSVEIYRMIWAARFK